MRRLFIAMLAVMLLAGPVMAGGISREILASTTLDDSPTSAYTAKVNVQTWKRAGFYVTYDETEVGNSISMAITLERSYDGTTWVTGAEFYDTAGIAAPQTSENLTADGNYFMYLIDWMMVAPYYRLKLTATNTDTDDIAVVSAYVVGTN